MITISEKQLSVLNANIGKLGDWHDRNKTKLNQTEETEILMLIADLGKFSTKLIERNATSEDANSETTEDNG